MPGILYKINDYILYNVQPLAKHLGKTVLLAIQLDWKRILIFQWC